MLIAASSRGSILIAFNTQVSLHTYVLGSIYSKAPKASKALRAHGALEALMRLMTLSMAAIYWSVNWLI